MSVDCGLTGTAAVFSGLTVDSGLTGTAAVFSGLTVSIFLFAEAIALSLAANIFLCAICDCALSVAGPLLANASLSACIALMSVDCGLTGTASASGPAPKNDAIPLEAVSLPSRPKVRPETALPAADESFSPVVASLPSIPRFAPASL